MNLYDEIYRVANELEKTRVMYLENIQKVKESKNYTGEGKKNLIEDFTTKYLEGVDKANNERITLIDEFIKLHTPEKGKIQIKELNDVLALIKGLSEPLSDLELLDVTSTFNNNYATMEILERELKNSHIELKVYSETFKDFDRKKALFDKLAEFNINTDIEKYYFKNDINLTCIRYSLETLKTWEQEVLGLSK